jgi:hypothetical protein
MSGALRLRPALAAAFSTAPGVLAPGTRTGMSGNAGILSRLMLAAIAPHGVSGSEDRQEVLVQVIAGYRGEPAQARQPVQFLMNRAVAASAVCRLEGQLEVVNERLIVEFGEPARTLGDHQSAFP